MWKRFPTGLLAILMTVVWVNESAAQQGTTAFAAAAGAPAGIEDVRALVKSSAVEARLYDIDGPNVLRVGEEARFHATANIDAVSLPIRLRWDFGDGSHAAGLHTVHRYTQPGTYAVTFSISNEYGSAADTLVVEVLQAEDGEVVSDQSVQQNPER